MAVAKKLAIPAFDHAASIAQQRHDGMAGRGRLPIVAGDAADTEDDLRNFLLRGAVTHAVEGLQHATCPRPLLTGQASVRWNRAIMEYGEQTADGLQSIESRDAKRYDRGERRVQRVRSKLKKLDRLRIAEVIEAV